MLYYSFVAWLGASHAPWSLLVVFPSILWCLSLGLIGIMTFIFIDAIFIDNINDTYSCPPSTTLTRL